GGVDMPVAHLQRPPHRLVAGPPAQLPGAESEQRQLAAAAEPDVGSLRGCGHAPILPHRRGQGVPLVPGSVELMTSALTEHLRGQSDQELAALLRVRPDLVVPVPTDLAILAARAQSRSSVARVLDRLTRFELEILDALRLTAEPEGHTSVEQVLAITAAPPAGVDPVAVRAAVRKLAAYLLVHGSEQALRVVPTVAEVLGPYPAGLGRPAAELAEGSADLVADPARLRRALLSAPPAARAVLERLAAGPPAGTMAEEPDRASPAAGLVSRGLRAPAPATTVAAPTGA